MFISASTLYFACHNPNNKKLPTGFYSWESYFKAREAFYSSTEWLNMRKRVFATHPHKCAHCGHLGTPDNELQVDHKIPLWRAWSRRLDFGNLQILCARCNLAKGGMTDREFKNGDSNSQKYRKPKCRKPKGQKTRKPKCQKRQKARQRNKADKYFD